MFTNSNSTNPRGRWVLVYDFNHGLIWVWVPE